MIANWSKARSSVVGLPAVPQRASHRVRRSLDRPHRRPPTPLARAKHIELHGRLADGSPSIIPISKPCCGSSGGSVQEVHPLLAEPFDADMRTHADRPEGFLAKALAGAVSRNSGRRRSCRDRAVAGPAGRSDRGRGGHARPQRRGPPRWRIADDGRRASRR